MLSPMLGYAATALGYIATKRDGPVQVREVAEAMHIPAPYLAKIVQQLAREGYLVTRRGSGGGVSLAIDPTRFTLFDLCVALDEPSLRPQCLLGLPECSDATACPGHAISTELRSRKIEFLKRTTLADVGRFDAAGSPKSKAARAAGRRKTTARRKRAAHGPDRKGSG